SSDLASCASVGVGTPQGMPGWSVPSAKWTWVSGAWTSPGVVGAWKRCARALTDSRAKATRTRLQRKAGAQRETRSMALGRGDGVRPGEAAPDARSVLRTGGYGDEAGGGRGVGLGGSTWSEYTPPPRCVRLGRHLDQEAPSPTKLPQNQPPRGAARRPRSERDGQVERDEPLVRPGNEAGTQA